MSMTKQDVAVFAAEFVDNLDHMDGEDGFEHDYECAMFIVADQDDDGEIRVAMRTSTVNGIVNVKVLQAAQLLETKTMLRIAAEGSE